MKGTSKVIQIDRSQTTVAWSTVEPYTGAIFRSNDSLDAHPSDWGVGHLNWPDMVRFMSDRESELEELIERFGDEDSWEGEVADIGEGGTTARMYNVRVKDFGSAVTTLLQPTNSDGDVSDFLLIIPAHRIRRCTVKSISPAIFSLPLKDLTDLFGEVFKALAGRSPITRVFSMCIAPSVADPESILPTLVRAISRWTQKRDGARAAAPISGNEPQNLATVSA